jgi:ABC-type glycerol-3-phosphate transport system substrate-binding protein
MYMSKKAGKNIRFMIIAGCIAAAAVIASFIIVTAVLHRKPVAAFYGLSETETKAVTAQAKDDFTFIIYDSTAPLSGQLRSGRKPDVVFLHNGLAGAEAASSVRNKKAGFDADVLEGMISSSRATVIRNDAGRVLTVPLLLDNYEIDINRSLLRQAGFSQLVTWADIDRFAQKIRGKTTAAVVFAGGDDRELINITGALCEALQGRGSWEKAAARIRETAASGKKADYDALAEELCGAEDAPFFGAERILSGWYKNNVLYPEIFHMKKEDVKAFMESGLCAVAFLTLSQHRTIEQQAIAGFDSQYYPSSPKATARNFTSPQVTAVMMTGNRKAASFVKEIAGASQEQLSRASGLAPVQANSRVPDRQADDVRYWVAASGDPLPALSDAAFTDDASRAAFAQALRGQMMYR